ncbi:ABC-2 type transporter-domain-containing protein [Aspergillus desertorum]
MRPITAGYWLLNPFEVINVLTLPRLNALISITELNSLYGPRLIVEKQASPAFVYPFAEAFGGIVSDIPVNFVAAVVFNVIYYLLARLRYEPSQFIIFFLFTFLSTLAMSAISCTLAASTRTLSQAVPMAGVMVLTIVIYTGFVIPHPKCLISRGLAGSDGLIRFITHSRL